MATSPPPSTDNATHESHLRHALTLALQSPPKPTNYRVGALLVSPSASNDQEKILSTGYTLELPGNTHAEQCALSKLAAAYGVSEDQVGSVMPADTVLYTTMEPCNVRLSGNVPCVDRVLATRTVQQAPGRGLAGIKKVYIGVKEPEKFVGENVGRRKLEEAGVEVIHVGGMEEEILAVATAGHEK